MQYSIDLSKNIVFCEFDGDLPAEKLIENIQAIRKDPDFHKRLNTIANIQKATLPKGFLEMNTVADFVKETSLHRGDFKLALVTEQSDTISANLYKTLAMDDCIQVFSSEKEAEAWLTLGDS